MNTSERGLPAETWPPDDPVETLLGFLRERYNDHPEHDAVLGRIERQLPRLWEAYTEVYGSGHEAVTWLLEAIEAAVETYDERSERLHSLDRSRVGTDDWFQGPEEVGYMCYVDLFAKSL